MPYWIPHTNNIYLSYDGTLTIHCYYGWENYLPDKPPDLRDGFTREIYYRWWYAPPERFGINTQEEKIRAGITKQRIHRQTGTGRTFEQQMTLMEDHLSFGSYQDKKILSTNYTFQTGWYGISAMVKQNNGNWESIWPWGIYDGRTVGDEPSIFFLLNPTTLGFQLEPPVRVPEKHPEHLPKPEIDIDERPLVTLRTTIKPTKCKANVVPKERRNIKQGTTEDAIVVSVPNGWKFITWHKDATGQDRTATITMDKNKEAIALFEQDKVGVNIIIQPSGSGRVIPSEVTEVLHGDILTLMAIPDSGYNFKRWVANDGSTISEQQTYGHKITTSTNITAEFEQVKFSVQFKRHGNGVGRLQIDGEEINESTLALGTTKKYSLNKQISIKAIANDDSRFVAWEDGTTNTERQITVDAQHVVRPLFLKYPKNDLTPVFSFIPHCEVVSV